MASSLTVSPGFFMSFIRSAIEAVDPGKLVKRALANTNLPPDVFIISVGKAASSMAEGALSLFPSAKCLIVAPSSQREALAARFNPPHRMYFASHPLPSVVGVEASSAVLDAICSLPPSAHILFLLSGGASALLCLPPPEVPLDDKVATTALLLESGAPIEEINCVRKHLSLIKGGRLSAAAYPRPVLALIISDVVGDDLATVGSGPTVPDPSTFAEAVDICFRCHILDRLPPSVRSYLLMPLPGRESPKPGDKIFSTTRNALIGSATDSWKAIGGYAKALGIHAELVSAKMSGEARTWGRDLAERELPKRLQERREGLFVFTGELTVTIGGHGVGGRNQEMLLAFAIAAKEKDLVKHEWSICALAMDGLEGNSPAMGAALSSACLLSLKEEEIEEAKQALDDNDSHSFWKKRNMCILTGETGTNVNDIVLLYVKP